MKFITDSASRCAARIGSITQLEGFPGAAFETPLLLIYTKRGSVPHLTKDVFKKLTAEKQFLVASLPSTVPMLGSVKNVDSLGEFVSMKEYPILLSIQDPASQTPRGYQKNDSIPVWTQGGRSSFDAETYMDLVEAFKPDIYVALCDGDTDETSTTKRISKAVDRSKNQFAKCLARHKSSDVLKRKGILGAVEGGYDLKARERSAQFLVDRDPDGFVIDGLHINGPEVQNLSFADIKNVVEHTLNLLPAEKMKVSMGCWNPVVVLELVGQGVDVFDSSYPYVITESSKALTFTCVLHQHSDDNKREAISVADKCFVDDFSPICDTCECLTCRNHTRAYLNHLYNTKELLGPILLMIHNTHQYLRFFEAIRDSLKNGTFEALKSKIVSRFAQDS